jgi:hypothetical protein
MFVFPENLCENIECAHVHVKFYFRFFSTFLRKKYLCIFNSRFICTYEPKHHLPPFRPSLQDMGFSVTRQGATSNNIIVTILLQRLPFTEGINIKLHGLFKPETWLMQKKVLLCFLMLTPAPRLKKRGELQVLHRVLNNWRNKVISRIKGTKLA